MSSTRALHHTEFHRTHHLGWLRAAVLGANDGIISTASLIIGVAAAGSAHNVTLTTGVAALVAGAMSMAAGEYISVSSQADSEKADLSRERNELATDFDSELKELTNIYISRGLQPALALQVAKELTAHDALGAHARDELGILETSQARPIQAAISSALSFAIGAGLPLMVTLLVNENNIVNAVAIASILLLALLGALAAKIGGASIWIGALRITFWGALAMLATAGIGQLFGVTVG